MSLNPQIDNLPDKPINVQGIAVGLPKYNPVDGGSGGNQTKPPTFEEIIAGIQTSPRGLENIPAKDIYLGGRYNQSFPGRDPEEMYAQQQTSMDRWANGLAKMTGTAGTTFLNGTVGFVTGIGSMIGTGKFSSLYDNPVNRGLDDFNKKMEDWLPNYYTSAERDASWYSPKNILTANFWSDKVLKNLGFSIGTMAGGFAWGTVFKAMGLTNALVRAGKGFETVEAVEGAITAAPKGGAFGSIQNALTSLSTKYVRPGLGAMIPGERGIVSVMGTLGEAGMEAINNANEYRNNMIAQYKSTYGKNPEGVELEEINAYADKVGNFSWGMNVALLSATNYIQLPKILNSSKTIEKREMNNIIRDQIEKGATTAEKIGIGFKHDASLLEKIAGKPGRFVNKYIVNPAKLMFAPIEAFEEGAQFSIQEGTQSFFGRAQQNHEDISDFWTNLTESMGEVLTEGVRKTLTTKEGMENILIGGISGGLQTSFSPFGQSNIKQRGITGEGGLKGRNTQIAIDALAKSKNLTQVIKDGIKYTNIAINSQKLRQQAIANDDKLAEKDYEEDYALSYILPRIKYGKGEIIKEELKLYRDQASTIEGFQELQSEGLTLPNETNIAFITRLDKIQETANQVEQTYNMLDDKYSALLTPKGERLYEDKVIEKMAYAVAKIALHDDRLSNLNLKLASKGVMTSNLITAIENSEAWQTGNLDKVIDDEIVTKEMDKLLAQVDAKKLTEPDELKRDVADFADLILKRQSFMNEYNEIKSTPEKYIEKEEVPDKPIATPGAKKETIIIKTKVGERSIETNIEYMLGKVVEYSEKGHEVYRAPRIVILGEELENGEIKIKIRDSKGNERLISKDEFEDYSLTPISRIAGDKKASFFQAHWNTMFEHYGLKDKQGKPRVGRLEYNNAKDKLTFVFKDDNGNIQRREVWNTQFKAQQGFNHPMLKAIGELTVAQKNAEKEFIETKTTISQKLQRRNDIITNLYETSIARIEEIKSILKKNQDTLDIRKKELEEEQLKKSTKRTIAKVRKLINNLTTLSTELSAQNDELLIEKEELEINIPFFKEFLDHMDTLPESGKEMIDVLKSDIASFNGLISIIDDTIKLNTNILNTAKSMLAEALSILSDYINDIKRNNPGIPLTIDEFRDNIEKHLEMGSVGIDMLITDRVGLAGRIAEIEADINDFSDQLDFPELTKKSEKLSSNIKELYSQLEQAINEQTAKSNILAAFEKVVEQQKQAELEEEKLQKNEELTRAYIGTLDSTVQNFFTGMHYEPIAKKDEQSVVRATRPADDGKPQNVRANFFGFHFPKWDEAKRNNIKGRLVTSKTEVEAGVPGLTKFLLSQLTDKQKEKGYKASEIIALVMVTDNDDGTFTLVDQNGDAITDTVDILNKAIYQTFPLPDENGKLMGYYPDGKGGEVYQSMFRDDLDPGIVAELTDKYVAWRTNQLTQKKLTDPHKIKVSFGSPEYVGEMKKTDKGIDFFDRDKTARVSVQEAGLISNEDLGSQQLLTLSTTNEAVTNGSVTFRTPLGKVFLKVQGGLAKLFNRKFSEKEAMVIYDVIHQITKNALTHPLKKGKLTAEDNELFDWLKTIVYWGIAHDPDTKQRKKAGYNNVWFEKVQEDGKWVNKLFISGISNNQMGFIFTPTGIENAKRDIIFLLQQLYHNTYGPKVNSNSYNTPYYQITGIDKEGKPIKKEWKNYQTYLLSDKIYDEEGKVIGDRNKDDIPLVTQYRPVKGTTDTNRKGIYFTLNSPTDEFEISKPIAKSEQPKKEAPKAEAKSIAQPVEKPTGPIIYNLDGEPEIMVLGEHGSIPFSLNTEKAKEAIEELKTKDEFLNDKGKPRFAFIAKAWIDANIFEFSTSEVIPSIQQNTNNKTPEQAQQFAVASMVNRILTQLGEVAKPTEATPAPIVAPVVETKSEVKEEQPIIKATPQEGVDWNTATVGSLKKDLIDGTVKEITSEGEEPGITISFAGYEKEDREEMRMSQGFEEFDEVMVDEYPKGNYFHVDDFFANIKSNFHENWKTLDESIQKIIDYNKSLLQLTKNASTGKKRIKPGDLPDAPDLKGYRMQLQEQLERFQEEDWTKLESWVKSNFPNIPIYRVKNVIRATNGKQAWGFLQDGAIYLYEGAEVGTVYHEVFEAVWHMFEDPENHNKITGEFRNRKGYYTDRFTGETVEYSKTTDDQLKEQLAEEFRDFIRTGKKVAFTGKSWIGKLFEDIINWFNKFFLGKDASINTQKLFDKIGNGYYAKFNPFESQLNFAHAGVINIDEITPGASAKFRIKTIPALQVHDVVQHMLFATLKNLTREGHSLFLIEDINKDALYDNLLNDVLSNINAKIGQYKLMTPKNKSQQKDIAREISDLEDLFDHVQDEWGNITKEFESKLKTFNIEFDENDELAFTDDNKVKDEGFGNGRQVDSFRKANSAIKILLGSLPYMTKIKVKNDFGTLVNSTERERSSISGALLMPADAVHINLLNHLSAAVNLNDMFDRLKKLANKDPNYQALYYRLTKSEPTEKVDYTALEEHDWQLISAFWKSIKRQNADVITVFILPSGETIVSDSTLSSAAKQAKYEMFNSLSAHIRADKTPYFTYNKSTGKYTAKDSIAKIQFNPNQISEYITFLKGLNINFKIEDLADLTDSQLNMFREAVQGIKDSLKKLKPIMVQDPVSGNMVVQVIDDVKQDFSIVNISTKTLDIEGRLFELGMIKAIIENPEFESTYFNINGERTQTYVGTNALSNLYDVLSKLKNINELENVEKGFSAFKYLLTDEFAKGSLILQRMFNIALGENGTRKSNTDDFMKPVFIDGIINEETGKKKESSRLSYKQRLIQEININMRGFYLNLVPGDAQIEHAVKMHNEQDPFVTDETFENKGHLRIFRDYFISEVNLSRDDRRVVGKNKSTDLRFFKAILGEKLHDIIISKGSLKYTGEELYNGKGTFKGYKSEIDNAVQKFIEMEAEDTEALLRAFDIIKWTAEEGLTTDSINLVTEDIELTQQLLEKRLKTLSTNYIIANIELHKLIYSDPYQYADELKRIKNFNSPREPLMYGNADVNSALNNKFNKGFIKGDIGYSDMTKDHFSAVTLADVWSFNNNLEGYSLPYEEPEGGGYFTLKGYRIFRIRAGSWNIANEKQYRYDIAYEKAVKNLSTNNEENILLAEGNPNIKDTYTPVKPIVSGSKDNGREYNDVVLHKFALVPISFRILHEINPTSNAIKLYNKMMTEDVDYVVFESGSKVGTETTFTLYNEDGTFNDVAFESPVDKMTALIDPTLPRVISNIPFSIMSTQSELPSKDTNDVTQGSQITKLVTMDFMEAGIPVDFDSTNDSFDQRFINWTNLQTEEEREKASPLYKEIQHNQKLLEARIDEGYTTLLKKLGIKETTDGFILEDRKKLIDTLRSEILKREVNDNITEAFEEFEKNTVVLEATPAYQQIRNILYSIADKNVVRPHITGGMKVQIPVSLLETVKAVAVPLKTKKGKDVVAYASDTLKFYEDEDGKRYCEIMVGRWFKSSMTDEQLMNYFNNTPEGQKQMVALAGVAFRIPTQKQNSIDAFRIGKFLPESFGDSVVIPSALVNKAGSDFDIDKLSIYLKNLFIGRDGKPKVIDFLTNENSTTEQRYTKWVKANADRDAKKYIRILSKDVIKQLREAFKTRMAEISSHYKEAILAKKEELYEQYGELFNDMDYNLNLQMQDNYMQELFSAGKKVFFALSDNTREDYWLLKSEIRLKDIKGPDEISMYLALTLRKLERNEHPNDEQNLLSMATLYEQELQVLGATKEYIDAFKAEALRVFREGKNETIQEIGKQTSLITANIKTEYYSENESMELQAAQEIAEISELPTLAEFSKLDIYQQNTKQALENGYIQSLENLISHPANFANLVKPNSSDYIQDFVRNEINPKLGRKEKDYSSVGNMLNRAFMSNLRHSFITGRYAIGIAAVGQTNNAQNQRAPIYIDVDRVDTVNMTEDDKLILGNKHLSETYARNPNVNFEHYNTITIDGISRPTLSKIKDASGIKYISDIISQFIDGYVDISKGPWIMELGATPAVASTWIFLIKLGVPFKTVGYFMNQPIIRDYLQMIENKGYSWLFIDNFITDILGTYRSDSMDSVIDKIPNETSLGKMVGKVVSKQEGDGVLTDTELAQQRYILKEFLKYAKMSSHLFDVTQGSNFDTATLNDPFLIFKKMMMLEKAQNTIISSVDDLLEKSFIGRLKNVLSKIRNAFSTVLISDKDNESNNSPRKVMEAVLTPYIGLPDRDFVKLSQKAVADLFDWSMHTDPSKNLSTFILSTLVGKEGKNSRVDDIIAFRDEVLANKKHPLFNNIIIRSLKIKAGTREAKVSNLFIEGRDNKVYDQNLLIYGFTEIRTWAKNNNSNIYRGLVGVSLLQSGLANSPISFTTLLPYEDFKDIYNEILSNIETIPNLSNFYDEHVFERNNWNNEDVTPFFKDKLRKGKKPNMITGKDSYYYPNQYFVDKKLKQAMKSAIIPMIVNIPLGSFEARSNFIVYSWEDRISKAKKLIAKKTGDRSYIHKALMQKVYVEDENGRHPLIQETIVEGPEGPIIYSKYVYKAINAWGDSFRAQEFYDKMDPDNDSSTLGYASALDNDFIKVREVEDEVIGDIYENGVNGQEEVEPVIRLKQEDKTNNWEEEDNNCAIPI